MHKCKNTETSFYHVLFTIEAIFFVKIYLISEHLFYKPFIRLSVEKFPDFCPFIILYYLLALSFFNFLFSIFFSYNFRKRCYFCMLSSLFRIFKFLLLEFAFSDVIIKGLIVLDSFFEHNLVMLGRGFDKFISDGPIPVSMHIFCTYL